MRVVFMGTPDFAVPSLERLAEAHDVRLVLTRPDAVRSRGKSLVPSPVAEAAERLGIPVAKCRRMDGEAIARMREAGVTRCTCVGSDLPSSRRCLDLAQQYDFIYAAAGVHPHEAKDAPADYLEQLKALLAQHKCVALGEIGLDYYYDFSPRDIQKQVFSEQLELAWQMDVPVILHIRDAHGDAYDMLRARADRLPQGVIHCCSASAELVREYVKMGFYVSFAGPITFKKAASVVSASQTMPLERLLIETDSPYLTPVPLRGQRNEPAYVRYVLEKQAEVHGVSAEELAQITTQNAMRLYRIPA